MSPHTKYSVTLEDEIVLKHLLDELYTVFYCQIFILDQSRSIQFRLFDNVLLEHGGLPHVFPLDFHLLSVQCTPTQTPQVGGPRQKQHLETSRCLNSDPTNIS